ncbi:glycosyltransferase [Salinicoccus kekensis]|uniref:Glycosyltransferase involved in cell wall bisynthesis n=1 Tax=Salinicoccus kekensis TaxID=714307 RepID=A0A285UH67_9STAP|nr:glycosyltransferase [Salinicoccus kekensis]SOC41230.1 glycosyltransferase involved in cell wall bisynthesis [Salinicoccus kekensis]
MEKKKILFFIYRMGGGGAARTLLNIINNIDRTQFAPLLVTLDREGGYEEYVAADVPFIKLGTKRLRGAVTRLAEVIREERPDIVFSTIPNYNIVALLATKLSRTPAVNVVREAAYLGGTVKEDAKLRFAGFLYRRAARVIALSEGVKENIIKRYKVNSDKIDIIYNPVDVEGIQALMGQDDIEPGHQAVFHSGGKVIITAGRFHRDKDQKTLLEAFKPVQEELPGTRLMILGEGELEAELKQQAEDLGIADAVHFTGFRRNPYAYFAQSDLFVLSSVREGFGHVLTEALATGTPVVSTKAHPGAGEVLDGGEFGLMCEPSDPEALAESISYMLKLDEAKRQAIIEKGLRRAGMFHAEKIVKQYERMFTDVLKKT